MFLIIQFQMAHGGTDTATITITILGANDAPVAQNDVGVIVERWNFNSFRWCKC